MFGSIETTVAFWMRMDGRSAMMLIPSMLERRRLTMRMLERLALGFYSNRRKLKDVIPHNY